MEETEGLVSRKLQGEEIMPRDRVGATKSGMSQGFGGLGHVTESKRNVTTPGFSCQYVSMKGARLAPGATCPNVGMVCSSEVQARV